MVFILQPSPFMRDLASFTVYFGRLTTWDWYDVCAHTFLGSSSARLLRDGAFSDGKDSQCMVCTVLPSSPPPDKARANFVRLEHVTLRWNHVFTLFLACHSYFQSIYILCFAGKLRGEAFHSLDWILFSFPRRRRSAWRLFRAKSDILVTLWSHQYRLHLSATASRKGHFTENLFTYHGEAFHSSFYFLHHRAAVSLWMGIVWLRDIHCLLYEFNERTTEQRLIQAAFYPVSSVRFCFNFLFMGEIRSPNLRAVQINHKRAAPLRRSALIERHFVNFWEFYLTFIGIIHVLSGQHFRLCTTWHSRMVDAPAWPSLHKPA